MRLYILSLKCAENQIVGMGHGVHGGHVGTLNHRDARVIQRVPPVGRHVQDLALLDHDLHCRRGRRLRIEFVKLVIFDTTGDQTPRRQSGAESAVNDTQVAAILGVVSKRCSRRRVAKQKIIVGMHSKVGRLEPGINVFFHLSKQAGISQKVGIVFGKVVGGRRRKKVEGALVGHLHCIQRRPRAQIAPRILDADFQDSSSRR